MIFDGLSCNKDVIKIHTHLSDSLKDCFHGPLDIDGAEATPKGNRLFRKRPFWVLVVVICLESSSKGSYKYAWAKSSLETYLPPENDVNKSSVCGSGQVSRFVAWFTVSL